MYYTEYPETLQDYLPLEDWKKILHKINNIMYFNYPCFFALTLSYCCCLCTLGVSFCPGLYCIRDGVKSVQEYLFYLNKEKKKVHVSYKSKCSTSWIEIRKIKDKD